MLTHTTYKKYKALREDREVISIHIYAYKYKDMWAENSETSYTNEHTIHICTYNDMRRGKRKRDHAFINTYKELIRSEKKERQGNLEEKRCTVEGKKWQWVSEQWIEWMNEREKSAKL